MTLIPAPIAAALLPLAALVWAAPAAAQADAPPHSNRPAAAPGCSPEHTAMGHCVPAAPTASPSPAPPPPAPVCAPEHAAMGHCVTAAPTTPLSAAPPPLAPAAACASEHAAMGHCSAAAPVTPLSPAPSPPALACAPEHAAMGHCVAAAPVTGRTPSASAPAPYADRIWGSAAMDRARATLRREHGGGTFSMIMLNLTEASIARGRDGYRWDGEGWFGGDVDRFVVKSEGGGQFGERIDEAEVQALYSRAIGPYFNLQAGLRQDLGTAPRRTYASLGIEGLAPYWFDVEGTLFLSGRGDLFARAEAYYDQRITQRLVLQPRVELNLAAQDARAQRVGAGLTDIELGLRLRYEIAREFAPYVGVSLERQIGESARRARAAGEDPGGLAAVVGVRAWF
ncbi:copper resistance protein B [Sphingomonas sp. NBWT7]|uniref:copper resistance protein B n=1 Tax=Sphingomonas sp. NBWT7 TaxID=2596913 RepID=UPI001627D1F5|nr:copper resistance protein B [Sphingomonas sp. NBWT7]QNE33082.1 copper resistance protein B [Sphingomonas sp. NBWT7]